MKNLKIDDTFELQDIKIHPLTDVQLEELHAHVKTYEALINKRARKLKETLILYPVHSDVDYKRLLLMDYTFLKRPVFQIEGHVFAGNDKQTEEKIRDHIRKL